MPLPRLARTRVKICGFTCEEDAVNAISLGADALGFNTWPGSKRFIDLHASASWLETLPPFVTKVALTVNAPIEEAIRIARLPFIDLLQLHGDEDAAYISRLMSESNRPILKAIRTSSRKEIERMGAPPTRAVLLDAHVPGQFGGTGVEADLETAAAFCEKFPETPLILAGGLRPDNVAEAVRRVRPFAVDVSSGVESAPGRKSAALIKSFIDAVSGAQ